MVVETLTLGVNGSVPGTVPTSLHESLLSLSMATKVERLVFEIFLLWTLWRRGLPLIIIKSSYSGKNRILLYDTHCLVQI